MSKDDPTRDEHLLILSLRVAALETAVQMLVSSHPDRERVEQVIGTALAGLSNGATKGGIPLESIEEARHHWRGMLESINWPGKKPG